MNNYIKESDIGLEVGAGPGLSKEFIRSRNLKISDFSDHKHLDYKNIDAQDTKFKSGSYDFVIASNMIHHIPYPIKFFKEIHRILKRGGKLIIQDAYCSIIFQIVTIIMRHEGYDFTKDASVDTANMCFVYKSIFYFDYLGMRFGTKLFLDTKKYIVI